MKLIKKILTLLAVLSLVFALVPAAFADGEVPADTGETDFRDRFEGKSWEQVIDEFLAEMNTKPDQVGLGYFNTVTGEEHYLNGDTYFDAASMYKVPLNMYLRAP